MDFIDFLIARGPLVNKVISENYEDIRKVLKDTEDHLSSFKFLHTIRPDSIQGCFKIAKPISFASFNRSNCCIATDGIYIFVKRKKHLQFRL